ncbi:hypothetical protein PHMEG_00022501 [Phytophthora megakarya]|uniref:BZIP domain-containing protein n=1 Tax=Phytophthora megakarya TaxID=4795 RepID=A0A225VJ87_9STRA|nr:hypothetical protein PHMEG_00022501 [Phytophthora megakarya]
MSTVMESGLSVSDLMDLLDANADVEMCVALRPSPEEHKARRKAKHREEMVEFRLNKKQQQKKLVAEHQRLEREMKTLVNAVKAVGSTNELQDLVAEREVLRHQNVALLEELKRYEKFQAVVLETKQDAMKKEELNALPKDDDAGWRVHFNDRFETSFYFYPFTREEVDISMKEFEADLVRNLPSLSKAGTFFGWTVYRAPFVASALDNSRVVARTRVTKRLRCSLDVHTQVSYTKQKDLSPMVITPMGWGLHQRGNASTQVLQELDQDSIVFVHDIPGPEKSLRYLFQVRRSQWKLLDGRRKLTANLAIIDSDANRRSREADTSQDKIEWAKEGGIQVSVTEVDENSIDVVCDHWASCESKLHAEYLMIQWTQFAVWWEQLTVPSNLVLNNS